VTEKKKDKAKEAPPDPKVEAKPAPLVRRDNRAIAICVGVAVLLTGADLWSKSWAERTLSTERLGDRPDVCAFDEDGFVRYQRLPGESIALVPDVFELEYAENCGAAFGLLRQAPGPVRRVVFGIAAVAATIVLMWLFVQGRGGPFFAASVPLVISGAIGNFFDRSVYGYVVDFIHFHYEHPILWMDRFDYPTFNVADIAITIGVVLLLIDGMRREPEKAVEAAKPAERAEPKDEDESESEPEGDAESKDEAESETAAR
jgi:signal peptidase II